MKIPLLTDFQFAEPYFLWLAIIPLTFIILRGKKYLQPSIEYPSIVHLEKELTTNNKGLLRFSSIILPLTILFVITALARPQKVSHSEVIEGEGIEIAMAIDVSGSMKERDFAINQRRVNRLDAAKTVVKDFINGRKNDRIGVIVFSGRPHTMGPLTMNHEWLNEMIDRLSVYAEAGVDEIIVSSNFGQNQKDLIDSMHRISEEIIPYFKKTNVQVA